VHINLAIIIIFLCSPLKRYYLKEQKLGFLNEFFWQIFTILQCTLNFLKLNFVCFFNEIFPLLISPLVFLVSFFNISTKNQWINNVLLCSLSYLFNRVFDHWSQKKKFSLFFSTHEKNQLHCQDSIIVLKLMAVCSWKFKTKNNVGSIFDTTFWYKKITHKKSTVKLSNKVSHLYIFLQTKKSIKLV